MCSSHFKCRRDRALVSLRRSRPRAMEILEPRVLLSAFTVTNTSDSGVGSLRQAIMDADVDPNGPTVITFKIPGVGVQTIALDTPLPAISRTLSIDGTTQPGYSAAAGAPVIELDGADAGTDASGLVVLSSASETLIQGLIINRFSLNGMTITGDAITVKGCYIGTNSSGDAAEPNGGDGIALYGVDGTIGGHGTGDRNVISGNRQAGIDYTGSNTVIFGCYIGTNAIGSAAIPNGREGVLALNSALIGGAGPLANVISGNGSSGIYVGPQSSPTQGVRIVGNEIGTNADGTAALGNGTSPSAAYHDGITVAGPVHIGQLASGSTPATGNLLSGNLGSGIDIIAASATESIVGNLIGTDITGQRPLGNAGDGILSAARANVGPAAALPAAGASIVSNGGNLISGNGQNGILLLDGGAVEDNYVGTNLTGSAAIPNAENGIEIQGIATVSVGDDLGRGNLISGNAGNGILIEGTSAGASNDRISSNLIGTDAFGSAPLGNGGDGIRVIGSSHIIIVSGANSPQVISDNGGAGISLRAGSLGSASAGNMIEGNYVGTTLAGNAPLGNGGNGIEDFETGDTISQNVVSANRGSGVYLGGDPTAPSLAAGAQVTGNDIGTDMAGHLAAGMGNGGAGVTIFQSSQNSVSRNTIAGNGANGVTVDSGGIADPSPQFPNGSAMRNLVSQNSIFSNGKLGIDLGNDGVTPIHPAFPLFGPNNLENFPVILSATAYPTYTLVRYQLATSASTIEFFTDDSADPSGYGEGQHFVGSSTAVMLGTPQTVRLPILPVGTIVSATAIDHLNNTSEFAQDVMVIAPPPTVTHSAFNPQNNTIAFTFSKDVSASLSPSVVRVHNQTSGADVAVSRVSYDSSTNTATFQLPGLLPSGTYLVTLLARGVTDSSGVQLDGNGDGTPGDDYTFTFNVVAGDVNLDGAVSFDDLLIVARDYGQQGVFSQGDLNHDGRVDFADLLILVQGYGQGAASSPIV